MTKNKINKKIHYCWFGGNEKSKLINKCIESWKKLCPDYEIVEWNESNFDININDYVKEAYENKKWAFVSDYARLWTVYNHGGIYLDVDVELVKPLDDLLQYDAFFSSENNLNINTGLGFGAVKNNDIVKMLLDSYEELHFVLEDGSLDMTACTRRNTVTLEEKYGTISEKINRELIKNIMIFGSEYFSPYNSITGEMKKTSNTYGIHWYNASWRPKSVNTRERLLRPIKRILGVNRFNKIFKKGSK